MSLLARVYCKFIRQSLMPDPEMFSVQYVQGWDLDLPESIAWTVCSQSCWKAYTHHPKGPGCVSHLGAGWGLWPHACSSVSHCAGRGQIPLPTTLLVSGLLHEQSHACLSGSITNSYWGPWDEDRPSRMWPQEQENPLGLNFSSW